MKLSERVVSRLLIRLLWEDESLVLMNRLIEIALYDEAINVRAAAASALGRFILLGELGDLPEDETNKAQDAAVSILDNLAEDIDVRRRALEAIANSSHEILDEAIREAYNNDDHRMQISAVFAMGRSYDAQWNEFVLQQLDSEDPEMSYEAARAAGELEIEEAVPALTRLALDDDREVKEVAIWSLGEIGRRNQLVSSNALPLRPSAIRTTNSLEAIEDAIGTASLARRFALSDALRRIRIRRRLNKKTRPQDRSSDSIKEAVCIRSRLFLFGLAVHQGHQFHRQPGIALNLDFTGHERLHRVQLPGHHVDEIICAGLERHLGIVGFAFARFHFAIGDPHPVRAAVVTSSDQIESMRSTLRPSWDRNVEPSRENACYLFTRAIILKLLDIVLSNGG